MSEYSEKDLFPGGRQKKINQYLLLKEIGRIGQIHL